MPATYDELMGIWSDKLLPRMVDRSLSIEPINRERRRICAQLRGRVLELGFGSGLNIEAYPKDVITVTAIEPSDTAWNLSTQRRRSTTVEVQRGGLDGQNIAEPDTSFDSAVTTFTLCTIPDVHQALTEVRRVLRPGAVLAFLEHGVSPSKRIARWQRRLDPVQKKVAGGCHLSRDIPAILTDAGFQIISLDERYLPGPGFSKPWQYGYSGIAVRR